MTDILLEQLKLEVKLNQLYELKEYLKGEISFEEYSDYLGSFEKHMKELKIIIYTDKEIRADLEKRIHPYSYYLNHIAEKD